MALDNESGDQVGSIPEKNQRSKISWDYLFKSLEIITLHAPATLNDINDNALNRQHFITWGRVQRTNYSYP
jgi:hypothetical protein